MANISTELYEIMEAVTGEEVRGSIYRGLEKINNQTNAMAAAIGGDYDPEALEVDAITADDATFDNLTVNGKLTIANFVRSSAVTVAVGDTNVIDGPPAVGGQLALEAGTYLLVARFVFGTTETTASTRRQNQIAIYTGATPTNNDIINNSMVRVVNVNNQVQTNQYQGYWCSLTTTTIVQPTETTTYVVGGTSSIPNTTGGESTLFAVKLA